MMMTSMRQAGSAFADGDYTSSDTTKMQQEMLDHQWAVHISENGGIGLADVIVRQLSGTIAPKASQGLTIGKGGTAPNLPPDTAASSTPAVSLGIDPLAPEWTLGAMTAPGAQSETKPLLADSPLASPLYESVADGGKAVESSDDPYTVTSMGGKDSAFETPSDFVASVLPVLKRALAGSGLNPLLVLAQGALETGWGAHVIHDANGESSHNLFNIKASGEWDGPAVEVSTVEFHGGAPVQLRDRFRAYDSIESAVRDYLAFLQGNRRYQGALDSAQDPARFADELQKAGYATDPNYAAKIAGVLSGSALRAALANLGLTR